MAQFAEATLELVDDTIIDRWPVVYDPPGAKMEGGENESTILVSHSNGEEIRLFPNPNNGSLTLSYASDGTTTELAIVNYDLMGRELYRTNFTQNEKGIQHVEIPSKVSGFVLAQILRGNRPIHYQRLIIQR